MSKMGSKLVTGHPCMYAGDCNNLKNILCSSYDYKPEDCIIYKLMEDVKELKSKIK